ncbi:MAG: hypothetical protein ACLP0J_12170 [Solirubrobacteraceae bacterium]
MRRATWSLPCMRTAALLAVALGVSGAFGVTAAFGVDPGSTATRSRGTSSIDSHGTSSIKDLPVLALPADPATSVSSDSLSGTLKGVAGDLLNPVGAGAGALAGFGLGAIESWVLSGAGAALSATADAISTTTSPQLQSTWFSSTYWRVAALGALLTLPFLFAAAAQSLLRSDLSLLVRAAFGYLPLALLGVSLAAPLTMLLLAATDQLCDAVSPAGSNAGAHFLSTAALASVGVSTLYGSDFLAFIIGLFTVAAAIALLLELLIREAAVYVVVLMLPLAFAAFVWPARRGLAIRMLELLVALILSKFAVVAVLALGGAAYGNGTDDPSRLLTAMALVILSTFAPWAMLRLIPFTELAAGASSAIHGDLSRIRGTAMAAGGYAGAAAEWLPAVTARMRNHAQDAGQTDTRTPLASVLPAGMADLDDPHGDAASRRGPLRGPDGRTDERADSARSAAGSPAAAGRANEVALAGSGTEPATDQLDGIEALLRADNNTLELRLGIDDGTPAIRPTREAPQTAAEQRDPPLPQRDEEGLP